MITATGPEGAKTTTTDARGRYIFPYLATGRYTVRAELQGVTTVEQNNVRIGLGQRVEISFLIKPAIQEIVTVISDSPLVDITSTAIGANVSDQLTSRIPIGRSLADIVYMAPGVVNTGLKGANFSISGASGRDNSYIIDGAVVTHPGFGVMGNVAFNQNRGRALIVGGSGLPVEMIKEVQVITGGFEPEYGEALGGVINVITKSGGNDLHGEGYTYYTPQTVSGELDRVDLGLDAGMSIGGPILKNKLFFYGGYNVTRSDTTYFLDPTSPSYNQFKEVENKSTTNSYSMKITANFSSDNTVDFSASGDTSFSPLSNQYRYGLDSFTNIKLAQSELHYGTNSQVLRWTSVLNPNMFLEAQVARSGTKYVNDPNPSTENLPRVVDLTLDQLDVGGFGGNVDFFGENLQYSAKFTNLWKNHQFRYGLQFQDISFDTDFTRTGAPITVYDGRVATQGYRVNIDWWEDSGEKLYWVNALHSPALIPTTTKYLNWFVQDSWTLTPALNLSLGVRWEQQQIRGDGEGATSVTLGNNWAPRISATYDYLKNGQSKVFFHYGRYFEKLPNGLARNFTPLTSSDTAFANFELTQFVEGGGYDILAPYIRDVEGYGDSTSPFRTRAQYANEWIVGVEQEVKPGFSVGAHVIFRNMGRVVENIFLNSCIDSPDDCTQNPLSLEDWFEGVSATQLLTNVDGHIPGVPELVRDYKGLEITFKKSLSNRWQLLGSYRYAQLIGNYEGGGQNNSAVGDFALSPFTELLWLKGPLPNDIRNMVKLFSSYQWGNNLNTGIAFYFQTGQPITGRVSFDRWDDFYVAESLTTPRGALGRTDSITSVDVHADYSITALKDQRITFGLDIFNLFNSQGVLSVNEFEGTYYPDVFGEDDTFLFPTETQPSRSFRLLLRYSF